jgi:hypothetical protein
VTVSGQGGAECASRHLRVARVSLSDLSLSLRRDMLRDRAETATAIGFVT